MCVTFIAVYKEVKLSTQYASFGKKLELIRVQHNLTQADLAKQFNVSQQTISRWEAGRSRPLSRKLEQILAFFLITNAEEKEDWLLNTNYQINKNPPIQPVGTVSFVAPIPLHALSDEIFEGFVCDLLKFLFPNAQIHRQGGRGHKQDGADITMFLDNGISYDFQCKQCKQFGPSRVKAAVKYYTRSADKKYIVLSRTATPRARDEIRKYNNWVIWDHDDLARELRTKLTKEERCVLIDQYFPGMRYTLLGISEISSWQTPENFFKRFSDASKYFNHTWTAIGQHNNLIEVMQGLENEKIVLISGLPGSGKSKLLYDLVNRYKEKYPHILIRITAALDTNDIKSGIENFGNKDKILVIEDGHEQKKLNMFLENLATNFSEKTKLLILTHPYAIEKSCYDIERSGLSFKKIEMNLLNKNESIDLAKQVLLHFSSNKPDYITDDIATHITRYTSGNPFFTILASYLLSNRSSNPFLLLNKEEFKEKIYSYFYKNYMKIFSEEFQQLLQLIALIQPIDPNDQDFKELVENTLNFKSRRVPEFVNTLYVNGILSKQGRFYHIYPNPLADFIVERACVIEGRSTGFAEEIFDKISGSQFKNFLYNIGRFSWRLDSDDIENGYILNTIWEKLENFEQQIFAKPEEIISAITTLASYQPKMALYFVNKLIRRQKYLSLLPQILKEIAYNLEFINDVCRCLWQLAKMEHEISVNKHPSNPLKVLIDLCRIETNKPINYHKHVVDFVMELVEKEEAWQEGFTPLDLLRPMLKMDCETSIMDGLTMTTYSARVNYSVVSELRNIIIEKLIDLIKKQDLNKSLSAVKVLSETLHYPMRIKNSPENKGHLTLEFLNSLRRIKDLAIKDELHNLVLIEILRPINWHINFGEKEIRNISEEILSILPTNTNFAITRALVMGNTELLDFKQEYNDYIKDVEEKIENIAQDLLTNNTEEVILDIICSILNTIYSVHHIISANPYKMLESLTKNSFNLAVSLIDSILKKPEGGVARYAANTALSAIITHDRTQGLFLAKELLKTNKSHLLRSIAQSYNSSGLLNDEEVFLIKSLCEHDDQRIFSASLFAIEMLFNRNVEKGLDILLNINIKNNSERADAVLRCFLHIEPMFQNISVDKKECSLKMFNKLYDIPFLEGHWLEEFIVKCSYEQPEMAINFFMKRVEVGVKKEDYRPINYGIYVRIPFRFCETNQSVSIMESLRQWMQQSSDDEQFIKHSSLLFFAIFNPLTEGVSEFLMSWANSGLYSDLELVIHILTAEPNDFVINHHILVHQLLKLAEKFNYECINVFRKLFFHAAVMRVKSRTFGKPYPKDILLQTKCNEIIEDLPESSPAYQLYMDILKYSTIDL